VETFSFRTRQGAVKLTDAKFKSIDIFPTSSSCRAATTLARVSGREFPWMRRDSSPREESHLNPNSAAHLRISWACRMFPDGDPPRGLTRDAADSTALSRASATGPSQNQTRHPPEPKEYCPVCANCLCLVHSSTAPEYGRANCRCLRAGVCWP